jgi:segregation and condensation protein A
MSQERPPTSANPMPSALPSDTEGHAAYRVTLPEFEGPLDLLLHLCQTHELDILNISISFIAEKYIEYLEVMQNMSVEVAADYLVMAAHLAYLKSRELVPSPEPLEASEDGEDPIDPREELIRRLLQYQKYKNAAESLSNRPIEGRNVFVRGAVLEATGEAGLAEHSVWKLLEHWAQILEKAKPQYTHDVVIDRMSIADRINQIVDLLESNKGMVRFEELLGTDLPEAELRHKVVVSLLAVLELAKLHVVRILQQVETGNFFLAQTEGANLADARNLNVTSAKEGEPAESTANTAPMLDPSPAETITAETQAETTAQATAQATAFEEPASATADDPSAVEAPAAMAAADAASSAEVPAVHTEIEVESRAGDTAQHVPQEDVISAPFPASAEGGEEVIDGQTHEEQKAPQE